MVSTGQRKQCCATTLKGLQCRLYALPGEKVCHVHVNTRKENKRDSEGGSQNTQLKLHAIFGPKRDNNVGSSNEQRIKSNNFTGEKFSNKVANPNTKVSTKGNQSKSKSQNGSVRGNIYVFTYQHMMHHEPVIQSYLHLAESTKNNWIDYNRTFEFDPSEKILIKVGYTSKKPEVRIKEWRDQCNHSEYVLLYPGCLVPIYNTAKHKLKNNTNVKQDGGRSISRLRMLFKGLKLNEKKNTSTKDRNDMATFSASNVKIKHTGKKYKHLNQEMTCFTSKNAYNCEQTIHKILREKYGTGKMFCDGCSYDKLIANRNLGEGVIRKISGVHTEWFLVPRKEMAAIWDLIEKQCS